MSNVLLPELAENVNSAVITYWHFEVGDDVKEGDDLVEMATDKATFNVPATVSGKLSKKFFEDGNTVKVGETLASIE